MCKRLYWLEKVEGWSEKRTKPWLEFGSNFGELMAFIDVEGVENGLKHIPNLFKSDFKAAEVEYLVRKWELLYGAESEDVLNIDDQAGNEYEIDIDLSHMVEDRFELKMTGFIDKVWDKDGTPAITERKTTKDLINTTSTYWKRLLFDPQIVGYSFGLSYILDMPVEHGTYEVFRKPNKDIDKLFDSEGMVASDYRDKLITGLNEPLKRKARMVTRKPYLITKQMRNDFLHEFVSVATDIHDRIERSEKLSEPFMEFTRDKDACDKFLPCVYKPFCSRESTLENMYQIQQKQR